MAPPIVVAIDFGTTRSAWAYTVSGQEEGKIIIKNPDGVAKSESSTNKTETAILLGNGGRGEVVAFGPAALKQVAQGRNMDNKALFRWFKRGLFNTTGHTSAEKLMIKSTASTGSRRVPLLGVMSTSLRYFKDDILRFLSSLIGDPVYASDVDWVVTVPAIYDDFAKLFMRQAARAAGLIDRDNSDKLRLCLEPEAACVCVTTTGNPLTIEAVGKQIMILDCGGGTVDITTHHVQSIDPLSLAEEAAPGGGAWGSIYVDAEFKQWVETFLGEWFQGIADSEEFFSVMMTWEREKAEFQGLESEPLWFNLGGPRESGITYDVLEGLREKYNAGKPPSHQVGGNKKLMVILPPALVVSFFTPTINNIVRCLRGLRSSPTLQNLHRVFLVGGFSRCPLLQRAVRRELQRPGCPVVDVSLPDVAIVTGAVMFSTKSTIFTSRKARLTYGVRCSVLVQDGNPEHSRRKRAGKTSRTPQGDWIDHVFDSHINIGDDIPVGGVLSTRTYNPLEETQEALTIKIFVSSQRDPGYTDLIGCFELGGIVAPVDTSVPFEERGHRVQLTFGGPELTVSVLEKATDKLIENAVITLSQIPEEYTQAGTRRLS